MGTVEKDLGNIPNVQPDIYSMPYPDFNFRCANE